ncbi:MAG: TonB-dependent siderophore receptor [Gammaproteobacteria bacterium]
MNHLPHDQLTNRCKSLTKRLQTVVTGFLLSTITPIYAEQVPGNGELTQSSETDVVKMGTLKVTAEENKASLSTETETTYTGKENRSSTGLPLSVKETPQSVTVFTQKRMQDQDLTTVNKVLAQTPGISVKEYDSARQYFYSRGFEVTNLLIDGVPTVFDPGWGTGENYGSTVMYEQVEIIKGATGLMTGSGNPSAAVNLVRKRADSNEFEGTATLGTGSRNNINTSVDVTGSLNEDKTIRGRAIVSHEQEDSFRVIGDSAKSLIYLTAEADLSTNTLLTIGASHQLNENNAPTWGGIPAWYDDGTRTDYSRSKTTAADWAYWDTTHDNVFIELNNYINDDWQINARINHGSSDGDSKLLYVYGNPNRLTGLGITAWAGGYFTTESEYDMIDLFASGKYPLFGRNHEATIGLSNSKREFIAHSHDATSVAPIGNFNEWNGIGYPEHIWGPEFLYEQRIDTQTAVYGSTRLKVSDKFKAIIGTRITNQKIDRKAAAYNVAQTIEHDQIITPYLGLLYDLNNTYTAYASYTDIFNPQDERDSKGDSLDPIVGKSFELGLKTGFMNDQLIASAVIFRIEQDNLAQADGTNTIPGSTEQAYFESEGVTSDGYELEITGSIRKDWDVQFGWTSYEAKDINGTKVNTEQPRKILKAFTSYKLPGDLNKITIGGGVGWESENYANVTNPVTSNPERVEQESLTLVNLMAKYQVAKDFEMQLNVENLTDETYYTNIGNFGQIAYGTPRTISLTAKYDF